MRFFAVARLSLLALSCPLLPVSGHGQPPAAANMMPHFSDPQSLTASKAVLLTPVQLETLLPATVYFRGKTAPIQLRNAAGVRFGPDGYLLAALVDNSGYASNVQEKYQMYVITETALLIAGQHLNPGAYGAGIVNGSLLVMDVGGHMLLQASATLDESMKRPRPLQMVIAPGGEVRLYLGRSWIAVAADEKR